MTNIEWTHPPGYRGESWNPVTGCTKVSAGCKHCYAESVADRFWTTQYPPIDSRPRRFTDVATHPDRLGTPLRRRAPTCWFVNSMSDLFHADVPDEFIDCVFAVMALCQQHRFIVLTKRPEWMRSYLTSRAIGDRIWTSALAANRAAVNEATDPGWPLPNVWLGVSCEDQATADERIPPLLNTPAAVRLVSLEPLLGPVDLAGAGGGNDYLGDHYDRDETGLDWLIVGGESGPGARPCNVEWIRSIVQQGRAAGVPPFVKQLGARPVVHVPPSGAPDDGGDMQPSRLRDRKGGDPAEWPEDLRVREWPTPCSARGRPGDDA